MTIKKNARLSTLLNIALKCIQLIQSEYSDDIAENAKPAFNDLKKNIIMIMDWNGSELTKEHKIHDVGFYFIGRNDGKEEVSKIANDKGIKFDLITEHCINQCEELIIGGCDDPTNN